MNPHDHTDASLESRLRADARTMRVAPPDGLEQRIRAAVWRERETMARPAAKAAPRRGFRILSPTLAGLFTSACVIALIVLWRERGREDDFSREDIQYLATTVRALPARLAEADLAAPRTLTLSGPLTREIDSVRADARTALDFLAANFLPSQTLAGDAPNEGSRRES